MYPKKLITCSIFILSVFTLHAQDLTLSDGDVEWSEGTVTLTGGQVLKGLVKYNSKTGLLKFESGKESKALNPRSVSQFEYFDEVQQVQRKFYSIEAEDNKGIKRPQFFEILKELKNFAVVYTQNLMELKHKPSWGLGSSDFFGNQNTNQKLRASQTEIIFLIGSDFELYPYMTIIYEETSRDFAEGSKSKSKAKIVGEDFLKNLTGEHYPTLKAYAKTHKLKFDDRNDFLRIMDHYDQLTSL
jgi:hypothetical protein